MKYLAGLAFVVSLAVYPFPCSGQASAEIRGVVRDAHGGEPLARVTVTLEGTAYQAVTDSEGKFAFRVVKVGNYALHASTVGYKLVVTNFNLVPGEVKEFEVALTPDNLRQTTTVQVTAGPFGIARADSPSEVSLSGNEAKNLASVLADDPLRAVQALPGVTSDDDFNSRFSLRAADFNRVGLYLDDVLLHQPFHMVEGEAGAGSLTIFNGDVIEGIDLQSGAFPVRYADSTAGAVDIQSREGTRVQPSFRVVASASNASVLGEGPLGKGRHGDWIVSVRKSYLQYILNRLSVSSSLAFGFWDYQGRLSYDLDRKNHVSLSVLDGYSALDRTKDLRNLGQNDLLTSNYHYTLANLKWSYIPSERFMATDHVAYMREAIDDQNRDNVRFNHGQYGEWVWNADAAWLWHGEDSFNFGWSMRRIRDDGFDHSFQYIPQSVLASNNFRGTAFRLGGYGEQSWRAFNGQVLLSVGARWDRFGVDSVQTVSPQVSLAYIPRPSTRINFSWGQYGQEPDPDWAFSPLGGHRLLPERANSFVASVEQRLDDHTRFRVEVYDRQDRDLLFRSFFEPRLIAGQIFNPLYNYPIHNVLRGYARGLEIFLQRRSANRISGWISYTLGHSRLYDGEASNYGLIFSFPSNQDQRHTVNAYLSYRLRPTVNLSVKSLYGSGMPLRGFYSYGGSSNLFYLSASRNALREKSYERTDARVNKAFVHDRWKLTLYAEAVNILDRNNVRFNGFNGYNAATGQSRLDFGDLFPILPSAGIVVDF